MRKFWSELGTVERLFCMIFVCALLGAMFLQGYKVLLVYEAGCFRSYVINGVCTSTPMLDYAARNAFGGG